VKTIVFWIVIAALFAFIIYVGSQQHIMVKFLPLPREQAVQSSETDSDIHDAVNFVKKP
jgi:hypothetical protein